MSCCRGKGKVDGVQTDDDEIRSDLETFQPALIDTKARRIKEWIRNMYTTSHFCYICPANT